MTRRAIIVPILLSSLGIIHTRRAHADGDLRKVNHIVFMMQENRSFELMSISRGRSSALITPDRAERVEVLETSSSLFPLLGAKAVHGRLLRADDASAAGEHEKYEDWPPGQQEPVPTPWHVGGHRRQQRAHRNGDKRRPAVGHQHQRIF